MNKFTCSLVLLCFGTMLRCLGQHLPGAAMGNYAGTNALYHNPAFVADTRYSVFLNVVGTQFYAANNHIKYNAPYSFLSLITNTVPDEYRNEKGGVSFPRSYLDEKLNGKKKFINSGGDTRIPSLMISLYKGRIGVGLTGRARYIMNTTQLTEPIASLLTKTAKEEGLQGTTYENQSGKLHLNGFGELAFTIGGVILDDETDFIKVGVTVKRLIGLYTAHAIVENSAFTVQPDPAYPDEKQQLYVNQINVKYAVTKDEGFSDFRLTPAWLFGDAPPGSGWGFDIGAVYEYRPDINKYSYTAKGIREKDASKNKYLYRISLSLTDIGKIHFKNPYYLLQQETHTTDKIFRYDDFQDMKGSEGLFNAINNALDGGPTLAPNFRSVLPTAFQASIDYKVKSNVYVSGLWVQNLITQGGFGMKAESVVSVTPRYENKWYELSVPMVLMNRYRSPAIGLAGRIGPVWIGTDHLTSLLNIGKPRAFNLYFGVSAGLFRRPPEERNKCWPPKKSLFQRIFSS